MILHRPLAFNELVGKESYSTVVVISCSVHKALKNQDKCSVYRHPDEHNCGNLSTLGVLTEVALVPQKQTGQAGGGRGGWTGGSGGGGGWGPLPVPAK